LTTPAPLQNKPPQNDQPSRKQIKEFTGNGKETSSLAQAKDICDVEIGSVTLAVTGEHIKGIESCGTYCLLDEGSEVTLEDIEEAESIAREIRIPDSHLYMHPIVKGYRLDDVDYPKAPLGLRGKMLEANFHVIHGDGDRLQRSIQMVRLRCARFLDQKTTESSHDSQQTKKAIHPRV
jgi:cell division protein FtsA